MKRMLVLILLSGMIALSGSWQPASASEYDKQVKARQLFESKCGLCHSIDRPRSKNKTKEEWRTTVMRMKDTNSAPITDEEAEMIIDHLSENYGK